MYESNQRIGIIVSEKSDQNFVPVHKQSKGYVERLIGQMALLPPQFLSRPKGRLLVFPISYIKKEKKVYKPYTN